MDQQSLTALEETLCDIQSLQELTNLNSTSIEHKLRRIDFKFDRILFAIGDVVAGVLALVGAGIVLYQVL